MDALSFMKKDHRKVEELFKEIMATDETNLDERGRLFEELKNELNSHAHMEEHVFYPVMKDEAKTQDLAMEFYEEHHEVKILLRELEEIPMDQDEWVAKLKLLKENVEHHVHEEEHDLFPEAEKILDKKMSENLGIEMEKSKKDFLAKV